MEGILQFLQNHFPVLIEHKYLFLFLGSIIEGMNSMILGGFLISTGAIKFLPVFIMFTVGYVINGYAWYLVGFLGGATTIDRWVRRDKKGNKIIKKVEHYFEHYSGRAIVLTKFTFSLTIATLIMAGSLKYNLRRFSWYNFWGSLGWVVVTLSVGYFFGEGYKLIFEDFLINVTYVLIFLGGAVALSYAFKLIAKSAFIRSLYITEALLTLRDKLRNGMEQFMGSQNPEDSEEDAEE